MKAALIGVPFSGKSTVFQSLTGIAPSKKEESMGTIKVPDKRIDSLAEIYSPKKKTYAEFIISDFSVPVSKDSVISSKVKNLIQKSDLLILTLRNFDSMMTADAKDPAVEYNKIMDELVISDFIVIEKRIERERKEKKNPPELSVLKKLYDALESGSVPREGDLSEEEFNLVSNYNFLSLKKRIVLVNQEEGSQEIPASLKEVLAAHDTDYFSVSAALELELAELSEEEQKEFLEGYDMKETACERFVQNAYSSLGLISFLTAGEDEVRAWPIKKGSSAVIAAGKIHSDIARGFIRAETVGFNDFIECGSEAECKKRGLFRLEGKEYTVADGDIINFRFNV